MTKLTHKDRLDRGLALMGCMSLIAFVLILMGIVEGAVAAAFAQSWWLGFPAAVVAVLGFFFCVGYIMEDE